MFSNSDSDSYEFDVPEELKPWLEFQIGKFQELYYLRYVLENGRIKKADKASYIKFWSKGLEAIRVDFTKINDNVEVSTVFLSLDHNFTLEGPPILFETMVFGGQHDHYQRRYRTLGEAKKGHWETVEMARTHASSL